MTSIDPAQADTESTIACLAARIERTLPRITRSMFTLAINHPAGELPMAQLRACSYLLTAGASPITEIAEELGVSVSAATQIADRLEKTGFVQRECKTDDRRVKLLSLTQQGHKLMSERRERRVSRVAHALALLSSQKRAAIVDALDTLLEASKSLPKSQPGVAPPSLPGDLHFPDDQPENG
jgi:DNA-binding MarR family transcriptional regulator